MCPVHALRNIDSDKEGKACPSFPPRGGTRAPGRGAESRGFGRAWDYTRVPAIEGGRHHTQLTGSVQIQMDRVPRSA